ncbi:MAG: glycyl-radical enzyme activating protein [Treponema sp.]|jgi:pyruvate formate lyase activating enzyme|nr:glycyl-radical enzyme activating protein [Treponema sp.]
MSAKGCIFDIKEMAVFDGPGIRTTVFFKGCPLSCSWCHNPEGMGFARQLIVSLSSCAHCGRCGAACPLPASAVPAASAASLPEIPVGCTLCGACIRVCPRGIRRIAGDEYTAKELAALLLRNAEYLKNNGGGFTVSGGEPAAQGEFLVELLRRLRGNHRAIETSAFCTKEIFTELLRELELVMMDIKIADPCLHKKFTGQDNSVILSNLEQLKKSGKPFIIRVPLIPGVSDTKENLDSIAALLDKKGALQKVELLPYHKTAGAKYGMAGMEYRPNFDTGQIPNGRTEYFLERDIPCSVL